MPLHLRRSLAVRAVSAIALSGLVATLVALAGLALVGAASPANADTHDTSWYHPSTTATCYDTYTTSWGGEAMKLANCNDPSVTNHTYCFYEFHRVDNGSGDFDISYEIGACPTNPDQRDPSTECVNYIGFADGGSIFIGPEDCPAGTNSNPYPPEVVVTPIPTSTPTPQPAPTQSTPTPPTTAPTPTPAPPAPNKVWLKYVTPNTLTPNVVNRLGIVSQLGDGTRVPNVRMKLCAVSLLTKVRLCSIVTSDRRGYGALTLRNPIAGYRLTAMGVSPPKYDAVPAAKTLTLAGQLKARAYRGHRRGAVTSSATIHTVHTMQLQKKDGARWSTVKVQRCTKTGFKRFTNLRGGTYRTYVAPVHGRDATISNAVVVRTRR